MLRVKKIDVCTAVVGLILVFVVTAFGTSWAYTRGGHDFSVFFEAWRLVLSGKGHQIYHVSPDRFLYSPGFAWLLAPLGLVPRSISLGIWCLSKIALVYFMIKKLAEPWRYRSPLIAYGTTAWGVLLLSRPLLIDFSYGQVNLFILGACVWGLIGHFETREKHRYWDLVRWLVLTFAAIAKLYPLPLLLVPWIIKNGINPIKLRAERRAIIFGVLICLLLPLLSQGFEGTIRLYLDWKNALLAKGLPLESHNQSFTALLYHYMSGNPTAVLAEGGKPLLFGQAWLTQYQIVLLSLFWTLSTLGIILGWILVGAGQSYPFHVWTPICIGLLIVPSHLIWKPYFVMSIPLAVGVLHQTVAHATLGQCFLLLSFFIGVNLTGFDFIGHQWAAQVEAASFLLILHIGLIAAMRLKLVSERMAD